MLREGSRGGTFSIGMREDEEEEKVEGGGGREEIDGEVEEEKEEVIVGNEFGCHNCHFLLPLTCMTRLQPYAS
jgi:hypothetical protein